MMDTLRNVGDAERRTNLEYVVENEMNNVRENQVCFECDVVFGLHCPDTNQNYMSTHPPAVFCFLFSFSPLLSLCFLPFFLSSFLSFVSSSILVLSSFLSFLMLTSSVFFLKVVAN